MLPYTVCIFGEQLFLLAFMVALSFSSSLQISQICREPTVENQVAKVDRMMLANEETKAVLMKTVRMLDTHEEIIGLSGHLLAVSRKA